MELKLKLGWFTSGRGLGSRSMLENAIHEIKQGNLNAEIEFVFMHRELGEGEGSDHFIQFVHAAGIPLINFSYKKFMQGKSNLNATNRHEFDRLVRLRLEGFSPDICILAGYLLILSNQMTEEFRFINLHGALPGGPVGLWQSVIRELIGNNVKESGINVFLVTPDLDKGPSISFCKFNLFGERFDHLWSDAESKNRMNKKDIGQNMPLFQSIREEGLLREPIILTETINYISTNFQDLSLLGKIPAIDLTSRVDMKVAAV